MLSADYITTNTPSQIAAAQQLANTLKLQFISAETLPNTACALLITDAYIGLISPNTPLTQPFYLDFATPAWEYRRKHASRRSEMLAKAINLKPEPTLHLIDATAGLGQDSFLLASLGYHLTLLEKSPIIHILLQDALTRAAKHPALRPITERLTLIHADALDWLPTHASPDVVLLDPMFPDRKKSAAVKKDMALLHHLLGAAPAQEETALLETALACARLRVVVKRPKHAHTLNERQPTYQLTGQSSRFDIYHQGNATN
jgi:16S rRNA (guanine1516-N2)-methyltransferase